VARAGRGFHGSIPTPGPGTVFYGGNTTCVEVRADDELIVLDAGSGIRALGVQLTEEFKDKPVQLAMLITHTHWDHIQGVPLFAPASDQRIRILRLRGHAAGARGRACEADGAILLSDRALGNARQHHLRGTQVAHGQNRPRRGLFDGREPPRHLRWLPAQHRAQFDEQEYLAHVGWGHSCIEDSVALGIAAKAKKLFLFHHDPSRDDARVSRLVSRARVIVHEAGSDLIVEAAREGFEVPLHQAKA